eukprot:m51a1_g6456 hypothetical protein (395) ;mRNA; r:13157-14693
MRASTCIAVILAAVAALASADGYFCTTSPERVTDTVVPYSVGVGTVYTRVRSTLRAPDMRSVSCMLYYSYIAADEQGRPTTSRWDDPRLSQMDLHVASTASSTFVGSLPLRNNTVLEVVSYCVHNTVQFWCGNGMGNIRFRMPPVASTRQHAARNTPFRVFTNPSAGSDNVIPASFGVATLTTGIDGVANVSAAECFAWYGYVRSDDRGAVASGVWDQAVSMRQRRAHHASNRFSCEVPLRVGHVLQATAYCVADGRLVWAPAGNANFRLPPEQQHPAGVVAVLRNRSTAIGFRRVPASYGVLPIHIASQLEGEASPVAGSRCVARFGYPARFEAPWPTVNETVLALSHTARGVDHWTGVVPLPAAGGLLEATARCTYNGIESWLGGNILVEAY